MQIAIHPGVGFTCTGRPKGIFWVGRLGYFVCYYW